ncbi:condensin-2 complex subunit G2-like [Pocillopora damicornis]|uniref:condensin-2 complex subunit G2-like n=1 Tax=Pocillopora damicornis TaxID=46731 RepID=UPI000F554239|nr:condensin-2 complex subunit G2-like [Pocillopora damicornis]
MMNHREQFLNSVGNDSPQAFLRFIEQHNSKNDSFNIEEALQTLPKKDHERLWSGLRDMTRRLLLTNPVGSRENDDSEEEGPSEWPALLSYLEGVTTVGLCALVVMPEKPTHVPSAFLETAAILHGLLMSLPEGSESLQNDIAQLCELWFLNELEGKEELITQTFPYLIIRSLGRGLVSDVKRVWGLRQCLLLMDFDDDSSESLKQLLHQCMIHPTYLKLEEGRRFLSYSFGLNPGLAKEFHKTIKNQIPYCTMNVLSLYGEVYFRAWRVASGAYLKVLEENCIQDLMFAAVHAQRTGTKSMASRLRKVLEYIHQQKKQRGVDEALLRLYQPIIWRAFKVANPMVRANAAALLTDIFPLQNPDAGNEEIDELLQKQFDILKDLLGDAHPTVRATAIHGVCRITGVFWELIPAHIIKMFLTKLVTELAFDTSSSAVRVAVFQGLKFLLDNRLSHPLLKPLLSNLQDLVHDQTERVRVVFLDVLLLVKGLKAIKFWNIVPLEQLLAQLEVEQSAAVIRRLVKLLVNSFHPTNKSVDVQATRCSALWQSNPLAARKFYQYVHLHTTISATGKFIAFLGNCLVKCAKNEHDESLSLEPVSQAEDKENSECLEKLGTYDVNTLAGLAETIAICWGGIKDKLDKSANDATRSKLVEKFTNALPILFGVFKQTRIQAACLVIAGFLPSSSLPAFSAKCLSSLSSLPASSLSSEYGPLLNCLCSWDRTTDVLELIKDLIASRMTGQRKDIKMGEKTRHRKKSVTFQLPPENKHMLALDFLSWMMGEPTCRTAVQEHHDKLRKIADNLRLIMAIIESHLTSTDSVPVPLFESDVEFFQKAFQAYCLSEIHLHHMEKNDDHEGALTAMENVLVWGDRVLLPVIKKDRKVSDESMKVATGAKRVREEEKFCCLVIHLVETILICLSEIFMLRMAEEKFYNQAAVFTTSVAKIGCKAVEFLPHLSKLLYQLAESVLLSDETGNVTVQSGPVSIVLTNVLQILTACDSTEVDVLPQALLTFRPALAEVLQLTELGRKRGSGSNACFFKPLVSAVLTNITQQTHVVEDVTDAVPELPTFASFIVKIITSAHALLRSFSLELKEQVLSGAVDENIDQQGAVISLLGALGGKTETNVIKTCALHIDEQLKTCDRGDFVEQRKDIQRARSQVQTFLSKLQIVT